MNNNIEIQRGKLVGQQGSGSLYVDTDGSSYIISSADKWYDRSLVNSHIEKDLLEIHDSRLEMILKTDKFLEAPAYLESSDKNADNTNLMIPVARFPRVEYCDFCGHIENASAKSKGLPRQCKHCKHKVTFIQFPIVIICTKGHIDDFPCDRYVHSKFGRDKNKEHDLFVEKRGSSILNWTITCKCGASHSLAGVTGRSMGGSVSPYMKEMNGAKCLGMKPWTGSTTGEECSEVPVAILKNSLNIYQPEIVEALSLTFDSKDKIDSYEGILNQEFDHLNLMINDVDKDKLDVKNSFESVDTIIKSVNFVSKLQQIVVQTNFHRDSPTDEIESYDNAKNGPKDSLIFSDDLRRNARNWYPAKRLYGEGIFIELNSELLEKWENTDIVSEHDKFLDERVGDFYLRTKFSSASAVLIHTLSHFLIREVSKLAGYPMTSIREKLYLDESRHGILLYVTDTDKDGTFGGLVRLAQEDKFKKILAQAIENTAWCSSDPVCYELGEEEGQGIQQSNGAACHNCSFVPSTSCIGRNCFLDRDYLARYDSEVSILKYYKMV